MSKPRKLHTIWKGALELGALSCMVALHSAVSTEERISFRTLNRRSRNPVQRIYVDAETGETVEREDQVRGYETSPGTYVELTPEDIARAIPASDKTMKLEAFVRCPQVDTLFLDKPYFVSPADAANSEAYDLISDGLEETGSAVIVRSVLFRRLRSLLIYSHDGSLLASTLKYDHEIVSAEAVFADVAKLRVEGEMLDLAKHIIQTKMGEFDPEAFEDRYDAALAELVKAKVEGRKIAIRPPAPPSNVIDLLSALRESAGKRSPASEPKRMRRGRPSTSTRKAR